MGDDALVDGCLNGDAAAWAELHCLVRRLAGGLAGARFHLDSGMIEDVTQSTLENLLRYDCRALRAFRGASAFSTYLGAIILSVAARHSTSRQREEPLSLYREQFFPPPPTITWMLTICSVISHRASRWLSGWTWSGTPRRRLPTCSPAPATNR